MGSEREYVLKWHSFSSTIQGVFRRLLENSAFADVTLAVDNETLHCHRLVLSACSTYFENLLTNHPHSHPIIILHDIPHTVLSALVKFMYSGEIRLPQNQLQCFLKVAETLRIKGLTETDGHGGDRVNGGERVLDSSQPPPLIPAAHASASAAAPTPSAPPPPPRPAAAWVAPVSASKRRTPEPSHERDEAGTPPRDVPSAKRRKSRLPQAVHAVHVNSEPEPESEPEPALAVEPVKDEPGSPELPPHEENGEISDDDEPALTKNEEEEEEEEEGEEEEEEVVKEHRLEEDIELVSGDTTEDSPGTPPVPPPTVTQTMQAASEAAASTLINSYGNESPPWKDPRWSSLLPEEKVMEAMGNMLDVPTLAAKLMKNLFTEEERINSNTTGDHGKQIFDKEKMDLIKSIVLHVSKVSEDDQFARDDLWVRCKMKIDKWNRDLRYARKKKDKDTSLPTMVKLELASGRDDEWERERDSRDDLSLDPRWLEAKPFAMQPFPSAAAAPQCSADM